MKLTRLQLTNITCFEDVTLDFTDPQTGKPSQWVVLLGENGTGKSTILQMISAALLGKENIPIIAGDIDWHAYVRLIADVTKHGIVDLTFIEDESDASFKLSSQSARFELERLVYGHSFPIFDNTALYPESGRNNNAKGWFACGYSPWRRTNRRSKAREDSTFPTISTDNIAFGFSTMFGDERGLTSPSDWLADLYFATVHPDNTEKDKKRFESAKQALEKALPNIKFDMVTRNREVRVREAGISVPLERLSDGYRSTLVWILDLVRRLIDVFPNSEKPLEESGVVLIDEIDLHLHPRWQREIVESTRRLFPNLQFIVATHSPFVAQDMRPSDQLIVLNRKKGGAQRSVVVEQGNGFAQGWRVDQILTSYLFGLKGTRNESVLKDEREYERLLDDEATDQLSEKRKQRLEVLRNRLERMMSAPGEAANEQYLYGIANDVIEAMTGVRVPTAEELADHPDDNDSIFINGTGDKSL